MENLLKSLSSMADVEILVMDNGSTDSTKESLKKYEGREGIKIIYKKKHIGLRAYKELFRSAKGSYIIEVDDDVLEFPPHFERKMVEYMETYSDYGFLALNVVQNEHTNGAKPDNDQYTDDVRGDKTVQLGPTGGWCSCFRKSDFNKIRFRFYLIPLSFKRGEDGALAGLFKNKLKLKSGIIKNEICFHACGPYYAKEFGHLKREIEKYEQNNLPSFVEHYKTYLDR